jgi:hypothetical protein
MSMSPAYQAMYQEVHELEFRVHDALDDPNHPSAQQLRKQILDLHEEFEQNKNPRDIEGRIKVIQQLLWDARSQPSGYIDMQDADHFYHTFEDMRRNVRELPNY